MPTANTPTYPSFDKATTSNVVLVLAAMLCLYKGNQLLFSAWDEFWRAKKISDTGAKALDIASSCVDRFEKSLSECGSRDPLGNSLRGLPTLLSNTASEFFKPYVQDTKQQIERRIVKHALFGGFLLFNTYYAASSVLSSLKTGGEHNDLKTALCLGATIVGLSA